MAKRGRPYRLIISVKSFISASTAAIFSAEVGWGLPNPRNDIFKFGGGELCGRIVVVFRVNVLRVELELKISVNKLPQLLSGLSRVFLI